MSNSCSSSSNLLNSDCLIVNGNKLLTNKKLRWIIYQNVPIINTFDDFAKKIVPNDGTMIPYINIMSFNEKLPDAFNNKPATIFIMDGFIMSPKNIDFNIQVGGNGYILVLLDEINNIIDYNNVQQNQFILAVDTNSSSRPRVGSNVKANIYITKTLSLKANTLYRISFVNYQNNPVYEGLSINTYYSSNNIADLDDSLLFAYATDSSINNTIMFRNNNFVLDGYLRWDYYSQDKGDTSQENYTENNVNLLTHYLYFKTTR